MQIEFPETLVRQFDLIYIDPPWPMYGDPEKDQAAGKHYDLMTIEEIKAIPVMDFLRSTSSLVLVWATCPRLDLGLDAIRAWGLDFRGVAFNWVKTRRDGGIINGQGIRPSHVKPTSELCLAAGCYPKGRPMKLMAENIPQVILYEPRGEHSEKPPVVYEYLERMYPYAKCLELFSRKPPFSEKWTVWGNEVGVLNHAEQIRIGD